MSNITIVVFFILLAFVSLMLVSYVNRRQTRARLISQKVAQMKRRVSELEELSASLEPLVESSNIIKLVNDECIDLINSVLKLSPESQYMETNLHALHQRSQELLDPTIHREIYRLQDSDAAIARSQFYLNEAGRIIRKRQSSGTIEVAEMEHHIQELGWSHMMVSIISHIGQGHKALNRSDVLRAYAYYKKAQQVAMQTTINDDRRHRLIKEISDMMANRKKYISVDLMPETDFNPANDAMDLVQPKAPSDDSTSDDKEANGEAVSEEATAEEGSGTGKVADDPSQNTSPTSSK